MGSSKKQPLDKATIGICYAALKSALVAIRDTDWYPGPGSDEEIKAALARAIIEHAASGERSAEKLRTRALMRTETEVRAALPR